ncbi:hypothetical protein BKA63DRAFT_569208 [Paraphoma chrysanthemicola]|nr:hypothetical protein BKA63DRAFT_569208 [Paraphoma chrysanthemicola]
MRTSKTAPASVYQIVDESKDQCRTVVKRYERVNIGIDIGSHDEPAERITVKKKSAIRDAPKGPEYQPIKDKTLQKHNKKSSEHSVGKTSPDCDSRNQYGGTHNRSTDFHVDRDEPQSHDLIEIPDGHHQQRSKLPSVRPEPLTPPLPMCQPLPPPARNSGHHAPKMVKPEIEETQTVKQETMSDSQTNRRRAISPFQQPTMNMQQSHQLVFGADTRVTSGSGNNTQWDGMRRQSFKGESRSADGLGDF